MSRKRRGRGEGGVFQRGDGQWVGNISLGYDENGKRRRRVVYGATKKEAQDALDRLRMDSAQGRLTDANKFTVGRFLDSWLEQKKRAGLAASTLDRYALIVNKQIKPHLGALRLDKLTTFHVSQLDALLANAGESARQRQMVHAVFGTACHDAVKMKLLPVNPCTDAAKPRVVKKEMKAWDAEQARRFLAAAEGDRLHALYVVALHTGMRRGELLALRWSDVDFEAGVVQVQRSLSEVRGVLAPKSPKTTRGRRRIDLSRCALDALHEHRKRMLAEGRDVKTGIVFCSENGTWMRGSNLTRRSFPRLVRLANRQGADPLPQIRFHDLRHTAASLLLAAGVNVKVVSERLGHESIEITLRVYAHTLPTMGRAAADKLDGIFAAGGVG
jgi:integrase